MSSLQTSKLCLLPRPCPECNTPMFAVYNGLKDPIGFSCVDCGVEGFRRPYTLDLKPAPFGLTPHEIIERTWKWQIRRRRELGISKTGL